MRPALTPIRVSGYPHPIFSDGMPIQGYQGTIADEAGLKKQNFEPILRSHLRQDSAGGMISGGFSPQRTHFIRDIPQMAARSRGVRQTDNPRTGSGLNHYALYFIETHFVPSAIVELGRARAGMVGHGRCFLQ